MDIQSVNAPYSSDPDFLNYNQGALRSRAPLLGRPLLPKQLTDQSGSRYWSRPGL